MMGLTCFPFARLGAAIGRGFPVECPSCCQRPAGGAFASSFGVSPRGKAWLRKTTVPLGPKASMSRPALEPPQALWGGSMEGGFTGKDSLLAGEAGRDSAAPSSPEGETTLLARQGDLYWD